MGRPKGTPKTGGKVKGSKNRRTKELDRITAEGKNPVDFLLEVMRDVEKSMEFRLDAAKAVAPYLHARRAPEDKGGNTIPPMIYRHPDLEEPEPEKK